MPIGRRVAAEPQGAECAAAAAGQLDYSPEGLAYSPGSEMRIRQDSSSAGASPAPSGPQEHGNPLTLPPQLLPAPAEAAAEEGSQPARDMGDMELQVDGEDTAWTVRSAPPAGPELQAAVPAEESAAPHADGEGDGAAAGATRGADACSASSYTSDSSSISGASSGALMARRLKRAKLRTLGWPDLVIRGIFAAAVLGILVTQLLYTLRLNDSTDDLMQRGPRVVVAARCSGPIDAGVVVSGAPEGDGVVAGLGLRPSGAPGELQLSTGTVASAQVVGTFAAPPFPAQSAVIVTSHPASRSLALARLSLAAPFPVLQSYSVELGHDKVAAAALHPTQKINEHLLFLIVVRASAVSALTLVLYDDGTVGMSDPLMHAASVARAASMSAVPVLGGSARGFIVSSPALDSPACMHYLYEAAETGALALLGSQQSGHLACATLRARVTLPERGGSGRALLVGATSLTLIATREGRPVEWDALPIDCPSAVASALPQGADGVDAVAVFCAGAYPGTAWLVEASAQQLALSPLSAPQGVHTAAAAGLAYRPLAASLWHPLAQGVYVGGEVTQSGLDGSGPRFYVVSRCVAKEGAAVTRPLLSQPMRMPATAQLPPLLVATTAAGTSSQGSHSVALVEYNHLLLRVRVSPFAWAGGMGAVGLALASCQAGGSTDIIVAGAHRVASGRMVPGAYCYAEPDGGITQHPAMSSLLSHAGRAISSDTLLLDLF
eukprot:TRINITY_DN32290_c1_g1_i1.p1 TRINITY_DN32290_c1_g1~~TRINITY_DN32290_c1_g1_i1.p1  ORF type:complete len:722 (+),score=184.59 TRINITY_DN32290_c1_g1_i1:91-2256(+)